MLVGYSPLYLCSRRFSHFSRSKLKAAMVPSAKRMNIKNIFVGVLGIEYPIQRTTIKQTLEMVSSHLATRLLIVSTSQSITQRHIPPKEKPTNEAISSFGIFLTSFQEVSSKQRATLALRCTSLTLKTNCNKPSQALAGR